MNLTIAFRNFKIHVCKRKFNEGISLTRKLPQAEVKKKRSYYNTGLAKPDMRKKSVRFIKIGQDFLDIQYYDIA